MAMRDELLKKLGTLGYDMFVPVQVDTLKTLWELTQQKDVRLLEGFSVVLATALDKEYTTVSEVFHYFEQRPHPNGFLRYVVMALAVYHTVGYSPAWVKEVRRFLSDKDKRKVDALSKRMGLEKDFCVCGVSSERLKRTFERYKLDKAEETKKWSKQQSNFQFDFALSQLFTQRQKDIIMKKARSELLTKTEQEYFSRVIKKKLVALANDDLTAFAKHVVTLFG